MREENGGKKEWVAGCFSSPATNEEREGVLELEMKRRRSVVK